MRLPPAAQRSSSFPSVKLQMMRREEPTSRPMSKVRKRFKRYRTLKMPKGFVALSQWAVAASQKAYEFAPNSYTLDALNAAQAVAGEIRKESTQPQS